MRTRRSPCNQESMLHIVSGIKDKQALIMNNAKQRERIAALEAENARLRAVVKQVEWTGYGQFAGKSSSYFHKFCDWCKRNEDEGHAPDCQRQAALGLAQTDTRRAAEGSNSTESTV